MNFRDASSPEEIKAAMEEIIDTNLDTLDNMRNTTMGALRKKYFSGARNDFAILLALRELKNESQSQTKNLKQHDTN